MATFASERSAQKHCPQDVVVWLDLAIGVQYKRQRLYGKTMHGVYACAGEVVAEGNNWTLNSLQGKL